VARVLVVEDKLENLDLMVYLLEAFGHEVLVARDGAEGVETVGSARPDMVVMDLQMPVMDGYEAAACIKAHRELRHIPLVAVTAYAMVGDRERALAAGFDGYVSKPIDPQNFVRYLDGLLPASPKSQAGGG
jgi:two-component system cell cycle response regulator